jgi:hypothetical protein
MSAVMYPITLLFIFIFPQIAGKESFSSETLMEFAVANFYPTSFHFSHTQRFIAVRLLSL